MAQDDEFAGLSRRERQIMDFLYQRGKASVGEVMDNIPLPPSYSAARATLRTLEQKGRVVHEQDGRAYIYKPTGRRRAVMCHSRSCRCFSAPGGSGPCPPLVGCRLRSSLLLKSPHERPARLHKERPLPAARKTATPAWLGESQPLVHRLPFRRTA